ncbi:CDP-glycerol glycerophosphotransferase family protein [Shewanella sp. KT0246]|uniref:CDP-glycerol glycerophosphotransferase family protein n=1 Tax=Shewanella sp. KT0246 TaxID=2815912 RepID=UPI001BC36125|nr:CDP-glycerol glycerophosphotransferase family protein [Shewanella sp. KT0246]GIU02829.1 CDP-glycerol glycerophosphotransferase family protein [Shewanella sp. KT0246]
MNLVDLILPKKNKVCFFITARTTWDPNQQVIYASLKDKFNVIVVDGNNVSATNPYRSLKCFYNIYRARVIIFDHSLPLGLVANKHYCINVWHGSPIKKIRCLLKNRFTQQFLDYQSTITDLLISNSKFDSIQMQNCFNVGHEKMVSTGLPRNIYLTVNETELKPIDIYHEHHQIKQMVEGYSKVLLWAPTYRGNSHDFNDPLKLTDVEETLLHRYLEDTNSLLLVRYHKFSSCSNNLFYLHRNIINVSDIKNQNILLRSIDTVITDYSSIWVDFLILKRPVIIYCTDLENYEMNHGFIHDFSSSVPSKVINNFSQVLEALKFPLDETDSEFYDVQYKRYHQHSNAYRTIATIEDKINLQF